MCKKPGFAQKSGQIFHQVDRSIVNFLYEPSLDSLDQFKYKFHAQVSCSFQVTGENPTFKKLEQKSVFFQKICMYIGKVCNDASDAFARNGWDKPDFDPLL